MRQERLARNSGEFVALLEDAQDVAVPLLPKALVGSLILLTTARTSTKEQT